MKADVASWLARGFNFGSAYLASQAHGSGKTNTECSAPRGSLLTHQNPDQDISQQLAFAHDEDVQHRNPAVRTELAKHKATMLANAEKVLSAGK